MPLTLYLSAPVDPRPYSRAVVPARAYRAFQHLFGYDAQLLAFADCAQQAGQRCYLVPAPEIFSTATSLARLLEPPGRQIAGMSAAGISQGGGAAAACLHVRFGMVRHQRLLKGIATVAVVAEHPRHVPVNLGRHKFAGGDVLPAGCRRSLHYDTPAIRLRRPDGTAVPVTLLPAEAATGDLLRAAESFADAPGAHDSGWHDEAPPALQVQSLHEFDPADWAAAADTRAHAASMDFRRVLINQRMAASGPPPQQVAGPQLVMVPWNLAHGGSIVMPLLERLARFSERGHVGVVPVLFPYNVSYGALEPLARAVVRLRDACGPAAISPGGMFIARLTQPRDAHALAGLFALAWIDAGDPEHGCNMRRLTQLGIACATIGPEEAPGASGAAFSIAAGEVLDIRVDDQFGPLLYRSALPTVQALSELVRRTRALPPAPLPPALRRDPVALAAVFADLAANSALVGAGR